MNKKSDNSIKKNLTIYYFSFEGFKKIGRLNNHVTETINWFSKFGNEVHFFNPKIIKPDLDKNVIIHLVPIINIPILKWISFDVISFFVLIINVLQKKPDVIYYRESSSIIPILISKLFSIPVFVEINGWILDELKEINYPKYKLYVIEIAQRINYKYADKLVPVSEGLKNLIIQNLNIKSNKIIAVNNGTNPDKYYPIEKKTACQKIGLPVDNKIIGFIGGCYPHHGIQHLINAAPIILETNPKIIFVVAGDGIMLENWKKQAEDLGVSDSFLFPGNVPYEFATYYINSFDICVAPWNIEKIGNFGLSPMKLFDYLACARPIVTSSVYGVKELVNSNNIGTTLDVTNSELFASTLLNILDNYDEFQAMANKGREFVMQNFTWEQTARKINNLFIEVCN